MIHAYLFLTNPAACLTQGGHGQEFQAIMHHINRVTGLHITVYHQFHDEVAAARTHVWQCSGRCRLLHPHYGKVARAMNRPPRPTDDWWPSH